MRVFLVSIALAVLLSGCVVNGLKPNQKIPASPYKSWSLALVCSPALLADIPVSNNKLEAFHAAFVGFGQSLGSQNVAIWFVTDAPRPAYDGERAADFCIRYHLKSSDSPYIVVTTNYPGTDGDQPDYSAVPLAGLDEKHVFSLMGDISDKVRNADLSPGSLESKVFWERFSQVLSDASDGGKKILKGASIEIKTQWGNTEINGKLDGAKIVGSLQR